MLVTADTLATIIVTALATAILTALSTLFIWWTQRSTNERDAQRTTRDAAYIGLIGCTIDFSMRAYALGELMHHRSGLKEGAAVTLGHRKPLDPTNMFPLMIDQFEPLHTAWSTVQIHGSQEGADIGDKILAASADLVAAATAMNEERPWILRTVFGEKWTRRKSSTFEEANSRLMRCRADLIHLARKEAGREGIVLSIDEPESQE